MVIKGLTAVLCFSSRGSKGFGSDPEFASPGWPISTHSSSCHRSLHRIAQLSPVSQTGQPVSSSSGGRAGPQNQGVLISSLPHTRSVCLNHMPGIFGLLGRGWVLVHLLSCVRGLPEAACFELDAHNFGKAFHVLRVKGSWWGHKLGKARPLIIDDNIAACLPCVMLACPPGVCVCEVLSTVLDV